VVAVYVSFILARDFVFYKAQRARGDILALPEVLCEPGKVGRPLVVQHMDDFEDYYPGDAGIIGVHGAAANDSIHSMPRLTSSETNGRQILSSSTGVDNHSQDLVVESSSLEEFTTAMESTGPFRASHRRTLSVETDESQSSAISGSIDKDLLSPRASPGGKNLVRVMTYGEVTDHQPSLLDQARARSAPVDSAEIMVHYPGLPKVVASSNETFDKK
jgi:hypothetical protein